MTDLIASLAAATWQPIESAPRDGKTELLGCLPPDGRNRLLPRYGVFCMSGDVVCDWPYAGRPTHWMPLPPPPEATP